MYEDLRCARCGNRPEDDEMYKYMAESENPSVQPTVEQIRDYVYYNEGTLNHETGAYLCDECYIKAGMPSSREGWVVPKGQEWKG